MEESKDSLEPLWTPAQVATYLQVSRKTVYYWLQNKKTIDPAVVKRFGNNVRIPRSEVERIAGEITSKLGKPETE